MNWTIKAVRDNPEVFAALVALVAVFGGLAGSYIGAKVQAVSGRAQASAATEAARISVEYQHLAAFHTDRRMVLASYLHRAEATRMALVEEYWVQGRHATEEFLSLLSTQAELELVAPPDVVSAALMLRIELNDIASFVHERGPGNRFLVALTGTVGSFPSPEAEKAYRAVQKVGEVKRVIHIRRDLPGTTPNPQRDAADLQRFRDLASDALREFADGIDHRDIQRVLDDAEACAICDPGLPDGTADFERARFALVKAGRRMLGSDLQGGRDASGLEA